MKKTFMFKFLISLLVCLLFNTQARAKTFVSIAPAMTEVIYAINAQDMLKGVSTTCTYPKEAQLKEKVGDNFFVNEEKILKIKPDYILAPDSSEFLLKRLQKFHIKVLCFKYPDISQIHKNILALGELTGKQKEAKALVEYSNLKIKNANLHHNKKILYLVQTSPMISVGKKSFITDVIEKSGNESVTKDIDSFYPTISEEYAINKAPDVVVVSSFSNDKRVKKLFPNSKIVVMTPEENDIVNRPGARIYKSVEFFAKQ